MSHLNKPGRDRLRAAGSSSVNNRSSTADCMAADDRPATPPELRKFRKSAFLPGERVIHRGQVDDLHRQMAERDQLPASQQAFGSAAKESSHVQDVFAHGPQTEVAEIKSQFAETKFRHTNVPIGKPRPSTQTLPAHLKNNSDYSFGVKCNVSQPAKELLFPQDNGDDLHPEVYIKSHGSYEPGAQTKRNYDWSSTGVNPNDYVFGKNESVDGDSAAACISQPTRATIRVVSKAQKDYMTAKVRYIGKPTSYGNHKDKDRTFGLPSDPKAKPGNWNAGDCIRGDYGMDDDPKLGKATRKGARNLTTETRAFGCPTIRDDVAPPKNRSVSDSQNYGNDPQAHELLFPSQFSAIGVHDEDFTKQRPPSTIRKIFANIGRSFTDDEFVRVWWRAATAGDINGDGIVSVKEFSNAADEFEEAQNAGVAPSWWQQAGELGPAQLQSDVADSQR
eukprot:CAMPEP_0195522504 /NCGR_PEP_ID=MMETSP0794_2-20130614/20739_1 /TAXON_ID=515487 /ORGANISM="Stephanopyxis turris, Strain CCMP 815" /LENGTH=447 /DNA_ID=CAMNT_0040652275 /DNA_START=52 /DNA_END=1395 /DNA_ORIENTATION=+